MPTHAGDRMLVADLQTELQEFRQTLCRVRDLFERETSCDASLAPRPPTALLPATRLMDELDELREHLGLMFAIKETDGYLAEAVQVEPRLSSRAERLKAQHSDLFRMLCRLIDECDEDLRRHRWQRLWDCGARSFDEFCGQLQAHEAGEADLLQLAANEDVGVGD